MNPRARSLQNARSVAGFLGGAMVLLAALASPAKADTTSQAYNLKMQFGRLKNELSRNRTVFHRPLIIRSQETAVGIEGEVFAVIDRSFARIEAGLRDVRRWCDLLVLQPNVKQCDASVASSPGTLVVRLGRQNEASIEQTVRVQFSHRVVASAPGYLKLQLAADEGPLGTSNYRISIEAIPADERRTFLQLTYAHTQGLAARVVTQGYLATLGRGKVGFSIVGRSPAGEPLYVGGVRGIVERNAMRYYLAVETALDVDEIPGLTPMQRQKQRFRKWYAATEQFAMQLHEVDEATYLETKRRDAERTAEDIP